MENIIGKPIDKINILQFEGQFYFSFYFNWGFFFSAGYLFFKKLYRKLFNEYTENYNLVLQP